MVLRASDTITAKAIVYSKRYIEAARLAINTDNPIEAINIRLLEHKFQKHAQLFVFRELHHTGGAAVRLYFLFSVPIPVEVS